MAVKKILIDLDLDQNQLINPKIHNSSIAPTGATNGQMYYNTTSNKLFYYDGTVWVDTASANISGILPITATQIGSTYSIGINQATISTDGSMIASDKLKLDNATASNINDTLVSRDINGSFATTMVSGLTAPTLSSDVANKGYVDSNKIGVEGTLPITAIQTGLTYSIGINQATISTDGSMIASDKLKLDNATSSNVANNIVSRDINGSFATTMVTGLTGPTLSSDVTNKGYVDLLVSNSNISIQGTLPITATQIGSTYSIGINQATILTDGSMIASDKLKLDNATSSNVSNSIISRDINGSFVATMVGGLTAPSLGTDAANKDYVDSVATGLDPKSACRVISTTNITLSGTQTIDSVSVIVGDRVLVAGQGGDTNTPNVSNGIYVVSAGSWSRSTDADQDIEVRGGMFTFITEGTLFSDNGWVLATNDPIIVDTTPLQFSQFSQTGTILDGDGLVKNVNTISIDFNSISGLTFSGTQLAINPNIAGSGSTFTSGVIDIIGGTGINVNPNEIVIDGQNLSGSGITWNSITGQFESVGDIESVGAGTGLTGGGTQGAVTLNIGAGNGIITNIDNIEIDGASLAGTNITWDGTKFNNAADITDVIAGIGLVGGGTQGSVVLDINVGSGLTAVGNTVSTLTDGSTIQTNLSGQLEVIPGTYPTKYVQSNIIVGSVAGPQTITHNMNSVYVNVSIFDSTTGQEYMMNVDHSTANTVIIDANGGAKTVNVVIIG